jgi:uncharacterized protein (TIGR02594 family)
MTLSPNGRIVAAARATVGIKEIPGMLHNPKIIEMAKAVGHGWVKDDETPWCASYVGWVLLTCGIKGTGKLNARSYLDWGEVVEIADAKPGDVCILTRGDPNSWTGHVFFVTKIDNKRIYGIGGNQSNAVTEASYLRNSKVLGVRRAPGGLKAGPIASKPLAELGGYNERALVMLYQSKLKEKGYPLGEVDGLFGKLTRDAVMAYQADNGLTVTGAIDGTTADLLLNGNSKRLLPDDRAQITADELEARGSDTIREANGGKTTSIVTLIGSVFSYLFAAKDDIASVVATAEGTAAKAGDLAPYAIPLFLGAVALVLLLRHFSRIKEARVDDARTGKNIGR